jgi:CBS domain-containing protein
MVSVDKIMRRFVVTAEPDITLADAAKIMTTNKVGSIVVMKGSSPVNMVTNDDIVSVVAKGKNPGKVKLKDVPKKRLVTVPPEEKIQKVAQIMIKTGFKRIPVMKNGKLYGIVSEKEIVLVQPQLLDIMSEKLKMRIEKVSPREGTISGICEMCEGYSDDLKNVGDQWLCEGCRNRD